jgi:hypothetical protein
MNDVTLNRRLRNTLLMVALSLAFVGAGACGVELEASYPGTVYDDEYPPDALIATTEPIYFEGRPTYWYRGRWHYREGGRWHHYDREPRDLYERRVRGLPMRRRYETPVSRGPAPAPGRLRPAPARGHFDGRGGHH